MANLIEATQSWRNYKNLTDHDMRNGLNEFGSINGYHKTIDLLDVTTNLLEIIDERIRDVNNGGEPIPVACANMIIQLVQIIVDDTILNYQDTVTDRLRAAVINELTAAAACNGDANQRLVDSIKAWVGKYKKVSKSNPFVKNIRKVGTSVRKTTIAPIGISVFTIIVAIAIIPVITMLLQVVDQYRFNITGMPEFSSAFNEFSGVDDMTNVAGAGHAILAYQDQANMAANGFGIINAGGNDKTYDIGDYYTNSKSGNDMINAALQRPSDQSKLVFAKGSIESGIVEINKGLGKKYVTSLYTYAEKNEEIVVDLFHEQMRVDIAARIGNIIHSNGRSLTDGTREQMWNTLQIFMRNRQDQFSARTGGRETRRVIDAMVRAFDGQAMHSIPFIDVIRGIDTANIELFERGLSRLFQQYTSYIEWNKGAVKRLLVQLPEGIDLTKYKTDRQNLLESLYANYIGPIFEWGKTWAINGRDHPITEYIGWKNAMIHYPWGSFATWLTTTAAGMKFLTYLGGSNLLGGVVGLTGGGAGLAILGTAIGTMI